MLRLLVAASAALYLIRSAPAGAEPVQPTTAWNVNYTATSCDAKRRFGDVAVVITPAPLGKTMRVLIEMPGGARRARQFPALFDARDGRGAEKVTALVYPLSKKGFRGLYSVMPRDVVQRAMASGQMEIRAGNSVARAVGAPVASAHLALGKTGSLSKALDTCLADLQKHWGMVDGQLPEPAVPGRVVGNIMGLFTADDYPEDAIAAGNSGTTKFLMMIGTKGEVMDCVTLESSGIASLDAMACQVVRERGRFQPATDAAGKPVFGTLQQTLRWVIE
jgi:TonB family protein